MAYELIFSFRQKGSDEMKKFVKKIGKVEEDSPIEEVLNTIVSQFARRDRYVESVEVYEFVKKKIKFKEVKGGYIIKDKKFLMDQIQGIPLASVDDDTPLPQQFAGLQPHEIVARQQLMSNAQPVKSDLIQKINENGITSSMNPQRIEIFDPDPMQLAKLGNRYKLTPGNKYGIYRDWGEGSPPVTVTMYLVKDDRGMEVTISAEYFVALGKGLIGGNFEIDPIERQLNKGLSFQGQYLEDRGSSSKGNNRPMLVGGGDDIPEAFIKMPDISNLRGRV